MRVEIFRDSTQNQEVCGAAFSPYSSSYTIENLEVELDRGATTESGVQKTSGPASQLSTAQQVRPHFLYDPVREIETYRKFLRPEQLGTPICYGVAESAELERYWLILERVDRAFALANGPAGVVETGGPMAGPVCIATLTRPIVHRMHTELRISCATIELFFSMWLVRAEEFLRHKYAGHSPDTLRRFGRLANRYDRVIRWLLDLPTTVYSRRIFILQM